MYARDPIEQHRDPTTGRTYYYNTTTRKTGWSRAEVASPAASLSPATSIGPHFSQVLSR